MLGASAANSYIYLPTRLNATLLTCCLVKSSVEAPGMCLKDAVDVHFIEGRLSSLTAGGIMVVDLALRINGGISLLGDARRLVRRGLSESANVPKEYLLLLPDAKAIFAAIDELEDDDDLREKLTDDAACRCSCIVFAKSSACGELRRLSAPGSPPAELKLLRSTMVALGLFDSLNDECFEDWLRINASFEL